MHVAICPEVRTYYASHEKNTNCHGFFLRRLKKLLFWKWHRQPGVDLVLEVLQLESEFAEADLVLAGEGKIDGQTVMGKAPVGVARRAKKYGCKVIGFAGCIDNGCIAVAMKAMPGKARKRVYDNAEKKNRELREQYKDLRKLIEDIYRRE